MKFPKIPNMHGVARQIVHAARTHTPLLLTATAIGGVVTTAVLAVRAGRKADAVIVEEFGSTEQIKIEDWVRGTWKFWIPTIGSGCVTTASIIMIHYTHQKRYAALMGLYVLGEKAFSEYRDTIEEIVDKNTGQKIRESAAEKAVNRDPDALERHIFERGETHLVYDAYSGRYFKTDMETIKRAENVFNKNLIDHMYGSLNEFYSLLGIEGVGAGEEVGWNSDKLMEIGYEAVLTEKGLPAMCIEFYSSMPKHDYMSNH